MTGLGRGRFMALADAARALGCSYTVVYRLGLSGRLRAERRGKHWYVRRADVVQLLRERATRPAVA